jgi:SPP1 gp7 family putative phage head morphogenesis protein
MANRRPVRTPQEIIDRAAKVRKLAPGLSGRMLDAVVRNFAVFLNRSEKRVARVVEKMRGVRSDLKAELSQYGEDMAAGDLSRMRRLIGNLAKINARGVKGATRELQGQSAEVAAEVYERSVSAAETVLAVSFERLSPAQVRAMAEVPMYGKKLDKWLDELSPTHRDRLAKSVRTSFAMGESVPDAVRRLGRVSDANENDLTVLARTQFNAIANTAAQETYRDNSDVLDGLQWVATLDDRTCPICGPLDGTEWYYKPKAGQKGIDRMPELPAHPQCRCTTVPMVSDMPRAPVSTWEDWLKRQDAATQNDVLGQQRAELYRSGRVTVDQFRTRTGELRSVRELRRAT